MESAIAKDPSLLVKPALDAPRQVKLRDQILSSLAGTVVHSVCAGQSPAEVISRAVQIVGELGAATRGLVFNHASSCIRYVSHYSAANPPRREVPLRLSSDA